MELLRAHQIISLDQWQTAGWLQLNHNLTHGKYQSFSTMPGKDCCRCNTQNEHTGRNRPSPRKQHHLSMQVLAFLVYRTLHVEMEMELVGLEMALVGLGMALVGLEMALVGLEMALAGWEMNRHIWMACLMPVQEPIGRHYPHKQIAALGRSLHPMTKPDSLGL